MSDAIKVYVINNVDRNMLRLRFICPQTGRVSHRSAKTSDPVEAQKQAGAWEAELRAGIQSQSQGRLSWSEFVKVCTKQRISALAVRSRPIYTAILDSITEVVRPATLNNLTAQGISLWQTHQRESGVAESTIESRSAALLSMLNWAKDQKYVKDVPTFSKIVRSRSGKKMKGRPLTDDEFRKMLNSVNDVVVSKAAKPDVRKQFVAEWQRSLTGLWLSGLRLSEAIDLSWDEPGRLNVDTSEEVPVLIVLGEKEKGGEDRILPLAPEFGLWLLTTPQEKRTGAVFCWPRQRNRISHKDPDRVSMLWVSHTISDIGEKAGVVVNQKPLKYASAHDFRRTFGERWRRQVEPIVLMELMRHKDIQTTMDYYSEHNSRRTGIELWNRHKTLGTSLGTTPSSDKDSD